MAACCTCYSSWFAFTTYAKGIATINNNGNYEFVEGQKDSSEVLQYYENKHVNTYPYEGYGASITFELDSIKPPKTFPIFWKTLYKQRISDFGSSSDCDCTNSINGKIIKSVINEDWKEVPTERSQTTLYGRGNWISIPNKYFPTYDTLKLPAKVKWTYTKKFFELEVNETYEAKHECGPSCPSGPAPKDIDFQSQFKLIKQFKDWVPVW
jgi:hypothetical protein